MVQEEYLARSSIARSLPRARLRPSVCQRRRGSPSLHLRAPLGGSPPLFHSLSISLSRLTVRSVCEASTPCVPRAPTNTHTRTCNNTKSECILEGSLFIKGCLLFSCYSLKEPFIRYLYERQRPLVQIILGFYHIVESERERMVGTGRCWDAWRVGMDAVDHMGNPSDLLPTEKKVW